MKEKGMGSAYGMRGIGLLYRGFVRVTCGKQSAWKT